MNLKLGFFISLILLYFMYDTILTHFYKVKNKRDDYYLGGNAPDEIQRFFGKAEYLVMVYYFFVLIALVFKFDFWGFITLIRILEIKVIQITGFILGVLALVFMTLARLNLGKAWRVGLDYQTKDGLVTSGFYKYMRNPYFTFLLTFQFLLILVVPTAIMVFAFIQSLLLLNLQVRQDEVFLQNKYGESYTLYRNRTGRFFPGFKRHSAFSNSVGDKLC